MTTKLSLSRDTQEILKNMSTINNSLKFEAGNVLRTMNASGSIVMEADIAETFPQTFSIYELNKLLAVLNLQTMRDAELAFEDDGKKVVIQAGRNKVDYFFTSESFVTHPGKSMKIPSADLSLTVSEADLEGFTKAAATLGHKILEFRAEGGEVSLVASTPELDTSNDYVVGMGQTEAADGRYRIKADNFKVLPGDYDIVICARGIMSAFHKSRPVRYFFGLERAGS